MAKNTKATKNELADLGNALGVKIKAIQVWQAPRVLAGDTVECQILADHEGLPSWRIYRVSGDTGNALRAAINTAVAGIYRWQGAAGWVDVSTYRGRLVIR